jgi:hypothetical protein
MGIFTQIHKLLIENWKTSATGLIAGLAVILNDLGLMVSPELQGKATAWLVAIGLFVLGLFSKDGDKSEEPKA